MYVVTSQSNCLAKMDILRDHTYVSQKSKENYPLSGALGELSLIFLNMHFFW